SYLHLYHKLAPVQYTLQIRPVWLIWYRGLIMARIIQCFPIWPSSPLKHTQLNHELPTPSLDLNLFSLLPLHGSEPNITDVKYLIPISKRRHVLYRTQEEETNSLHKSPSKKYPPRYQTP